MSQAFEQIHQTNIEINKQQNKRIEFNNNQHRLSTQVSELRSQRSEIPRNTNVQKQRSEPPLTLYKQLTCMSIKDEAQMKSTNSNGIVPTAIKPFDGTDPGYTDEEYLNIITAAMIFSNGIEPVK